MMILFENLSPMGNGKKITYILTIIITIIVNLLLGSNVSAKKLELNSNDVERIKLVLDLTKLVSSVAVSDDKLKTVLNMAISGGQTGADVTYGLVVLTSLNEMDFIDSVVSQRYKKEANAYFNGILDERLNLRNYYKGIGYDLPRVLAGRITSPMAALTLNTFDITEKTITIFTELNVLKKEMLYDGLFVYFDDRKGNENHKTAWEDTKEIMGGVAKPTNKRLFRKTEIQEETNLELESQFATLYEKWGPYVEMNKGVKKSFKKQVELELQNTLALAAKEQEIAEKNKKDEISFLEKLKITLQNLIKEAEKAGAKIQELAGLGGAQVSQSTIDGGEKGEMRETGEIGEGKQAENVEPEAKLTTSEVQEMLDDIAEKIDVLSQQTDELTGKTGEKGEMGIVDVGRPQNEENKEVSAEVGPPLDILQEKKKEVVTATEKLVEVKPQPEPVAVFNYGTAPPPPDPPTLKILITEVQISPIKERFVELYNPNNEAVNLSGWYIQRKTETGSDFASFISSTHFEGKTIGAFSYFFVASSTGADILLSLTLTEGNFLILKSPKREIINEVEWGEIQTDKSFGRKWSTTTQGYSDFEIQTPTPGAKNETPSLSPPLPLNQIPIASFSFTPQSPLIGQEIIFNASSSTDSDGTITSYFWDFGDNSSSSGSQATAAHSYSTSSDFLVNLTVIDNNSATSGATTTINITAPEIPSLTVVINEIAWMGTSATNSSDEWMELYNNTTSTINLLNWTLKTATGTPSITFATATISANGFYLLERTASNTTNLVEDQIYTGGLSNNGEKLELRDASNTLIDLLDFSAGWPAGTSSPNYISMERISATSSATSTNWANNNLLTRNGSDATGNKINGTPRAQNSVSATSTNISSLPFDEFSEITLAYPGSPYIVNSLTIPEGKILRIGPRVEIKFKEQYYWGGPDSLIVRGTLIAKGEAGKEIIFTSFLTPPGSDNWSRIYFFPTSQGSILDYVKISYGGTKQNDSYFIIVDSTSIVFKNSILENISSSGLSLRNSSSTIENLTIQNAPSGEAISIGGGSPTIKNSIFKNTWSGMIIGGGSTAIIEGNTFEEIGYPHGAIFVSDSYPIFKNNIAVNNALNGIYIRGTINQNWTLSKNLPYIADNLKVSESVILTVEPGAIIKLLADRKLEINGTLNASSSAEKIVFTFICDDENGGKTRGDFTCGYWDRIYFSPLGRNSVFKNVVVSYGGGADRAIYILETKVYFENLLMKNLGSFGLYIENSPETVVANSHFENITVAIQIGGECPLLSGLTFESSSYTILPVECQP